MSFSKSRKAAWRARISGDPFQIYSLEDEHLSQGSLWREPSQIDLSLSIPSRPQRLIIKDNESVGKYPVRGRYDVESSKGTEDLKKNAHPTLPSQPLQDQSVFSPQPSLKVMSNPREIAILAMICMLQILPLSALGTSFPSTETIATSFDINDPSILPWTVAAYALTFGTFILIAGRLGDIVGHRTMVIIGFAIMSLASLLAGLSIYSTYVLYFVARALQGIGSACMQPSGLALLAGLYPANSQKKNLAFALFGAMAAPGAWLGMLFGALLARYPSWAWASYALSIAAAVCAIAAQFILIVPPQTHQPSAPLLCKFRSMDWAGSVTGVTGLTCIAVAWAQAASLGWSTQYIYMLLLIGLLTLSGFILIELKLATHPLVPFRKLKPSVTFILASVGLGWASFGVYIFYLWQFLLHTRHLAPLHAALQISPVVPMGFLANALTGLLMSRTPASLILLVSLLAFTTAATLLSLTPPNQTYWSLTFASLLLVPFGMDMSFPAATVTISNTLPASQQGIAGSLVATVVNYSMSLGLGLASTALHYADRAASAPSDSASNASAPDRNYHIAFFIAIALGGLGVLICLLFAAQDFLHAWRARKATEKRNRRNKHISTPTPYSRALNTPSASRAGLFRLPRARAARPMARCACEAHSQGRVRNSGMETQGRMSCETLWEAHPAVRPLGGGGLIARD